MELRKTGKWGGTLLSEGANKRAFEAVVALNKYVVRIEDAELRRLVYQLRDEAGQVDATLAPSEDAALRMLNRATDTHARVSTLLGENLRSLY